MVFCEFLAPASLWRQAGKQPQNVSLFQIRGMRDKDPRMATIAELIAREVTPEKFVRRESLVTTLEEAIQPNPVAKRHRAYEIEVFNYLFTQKVPLGITKVCTFKNLLIDGSIELNDGARLGIEIKLRMNWEKACQAEWEFRNFLRRPDAPEFALTGGIVFFEDFSADWSRQFKPRKFSNGWTHWYLGHARVENLEIHLFQFRHGKLESNPLDNSLQQPAE